MNPERHAAEIWRPQPRQAAFMARPEYEVLYGGAAGGGKSDALLVEALRQVDIPHYRGLILRKTYPQLSELIDRSRELYTAAFPAAGYNDSKHVWSFPSGAKVYFGSMQHTADRVNYQGKRYDYIAFDELTHFTWDEYSYMFSRNRPSKSPGSDKKTRVYIRAATNPGGVGHGWVKDRFITPAPPMTPIREEIAVTEPGGGTRKITRSRVFVPSTVFDNAILMEQDPAYVAALGMLPEAERQALLYGSWDSFSGQVFREWKNDPNPDREHTHVIEPFKIPSYWKVWRSFDFGYARPFSVGWYAADEYGVIYRIREYYGCTGTPNTGLQIPPSEIAANIKRIESEDENLKGRKIIGVADPSIFDESRGASVASLMAASPNFIYFRPADNTRIAGKMQCHYRLAFGQDGKPMFYCFSTCPHFIRTIPSLVYSQSDVEDIDTTLEDHIYDEWRYLLMENPISPRQAPAALPPTEDPLNQRTKKTKSVTDFYRI